MGSRFMAWLKQSAWPWAKAHPKTTIAVILISVVFGAISDAIERADRNRDERQASASREEDPSPSAFPSSRPPAPSPTAALKSSSRPARPSPTAVSYPGKLSDDRVANDRGEVRISGFTMTLGQLKRVKDLDFTRLCAPVTLVNRDTEAQPYSDHDFAIQYPSGDTKGSALVYSRGIGTGRLAPGGKTTGQVCFVDEKAVGLHIVTWTPDGPRPRAVWLFRSERF